MDYSVLEGVKETIPRWIEHGFGYAFFLLDPETELDVRIYQLPFNPSLTKRLEIVFKCQINCSS